MELQTIEGELLRSVVYLPDCPRSNELAVRRLEREATFLGYSMQAAVTLSATVA